MLIIEPCRTCPLHTNKKVGVGKERRTFIHNWSMVIAEKTAPVTGMTLRTTGPVPTDFRQ